MCERVVVGAHAQTLTPTTPWTIWALRGRGRGGWSPGQPNTHASK